MIELGRKRRWMSLACPLAFSGLSLHFEKCSKNTDDGEFHKGEIIPWGSGLSGLANENSSIKSLCVLALPRISGTNPYCSR